MADFDKNMKFSPGLCGHFALGTLSKTYLKDVVFEINVLEKNRQKWQKSKMSNFTPKSKNVSYLDIILAQLAHFDIRRIACSQQKKWKLPGYQVTESANKCLVVI